MGTQMSDVTFDNYSRFIGEKGASKMYAWCVFMKGSRLFLNSIEAVEYILHPTFPDPVRRVVDREHSFALQSEGWGTFVINARVFFKVGEATHERYYLRLEENNWPRGPELKQFPNEETKRVYLTLFDSRFEWRKTSTIVRRSGVSDQLVNQILQDLSTAGYARKAYYKSIDNEELWGPTSIVGILPTPAS